MKKIYVLVLFVIIGSYSFGQIIFSEGFETWPPTGWQIVDNDNDGHEWEQATFSVDNFTVHGGDACAISESYSNADTLALFPDNWLITPQIDLSNANYATLSWWVYAEDQNFPYEHYRVAISTATSALTDFTTTIFSDILNAEGAYVNQTVDLANYLGQMIYLAFVHDSVSDQFILNLDDVEVLGTVGIEENGTKTILNVYPNPATDILNVVSYENISRVKLYNTVGLLMIDRMVDNGSVQLDLAEISAGVYYLNIETQKGVTTRKINIR
ncbi:choice-of-anchor J domain-containing protein [candidate division KSB1 bacterium]